MIYRQGVAPLRLRPPKKRRTGMDPDQIQGAAGSMARPSNVVASIPAESLTPAYCESLFGQRAFCAGCGLLHSKDSFTGKGLVDSYAGKVRLCQAFTTSSKKVKEVQVYAGLLLGPCATEGAGRRDKGVALVEGSKRWVAAEMLKRGLQVRALPSSPAYIPHVLCLDVLCLLVGRLLRWCAGSRARAAERAARRLSPTEEKEEGSEGGPVQHHVHARVHRCVPAPCMHV